MTTKKQCRSCWKSTSYNTCFGTCGSSTESFLQQKHTSELIDFLKQLLNVIFYLLDLPWVRALALEKEYHGDFVSQIISCLGKSDKSCCPSRSPTDCLGVTANHWWQPKKTELTSSNNISVCKSELQLHTTDQLGRWKFSTFVNFNNLFFF